MVKPILWGVVALGGALAATAAVNSRRFAASVAADARDLWRKEATSRTVDLAARDDLPAPVRRYLALALGDRSRPVRAVRLRHGGTFRTKLDGAFVRIRGDQYFATDPPGFVWWGRVAVAPGLWVDARDRSREGVGSMLVRFESSLTLADAKGPELDQGALLRLLAETTWFPTTFLDQRFVSWEGADDRHARATLRLGGRQVSALFEFGDDGLPARIEAERFMDTGDGHAVLTPWAGHSSNYRRVGGLLVPHLQTAYWRSDAAWVPYARFEVERIELDVAEPF